VAIVSKINKKGKGDVNLKRFHPFLENGKVKKKVKLSL
jgi:hypothetical protein